MLIKISPITRLWNQAHKGPVLFLSHFEKEKNPGKPCFQIFKIEVWNYSGTREKDSFIFFMIIFLLGSPNENIKGAEKFWIEQMNFKTNVHTHDTVIAEANYLYIAFLTFRFTDPQNLHWTCVCVLVCLFTPLLLLSTHQMHRQIIVKMIISLVCS